MTTEFIGTTEFMGTNEFMGPRERITASATAVIPGLVGIPIFMSTWAPASAVIGWAAGYVAITVTAWILLLRGRTAVESAWSLAVGIWFGFLPVTAAYWDPGTEAYFIGAMVVLAGIASDVSTLPHVPVGEWRFGVAISAAMTTVAGLVDIGWVALTMVPVVATIVRNADRLKGSNRRLEKVAERDELTGLLNRRGIAAEINRVSGGPHTVVMIDADRFKSVNDGYGHEVGDQVLRQVADALTARLGEDWQLGRQGGDEFVAVAHQVQKLPPGTCEPVECELSIYGATSMLRVGLSGGAAHSETPQTIDRLLAKAGYAMRASKRGSGGLTYFDGELNDRFDRMMAMSAKRDNDLVSSSLQAEFQIVVDEDEKIVGCEVLARWREPDGTVIPPAEFLPFLVESGQMPVVNEVMLAKGIEFASRFNGFDNAPFVAVNIGSRSLGWNGLVEIVSDLLSEFQVDAKRLMIEITETESLGRMSAWETAAEQLDAIGVRLAIDDFGAGYSNIERLAQLPISVIKFDRALTTAVRGPLGEIVRGVVNFAREAQIGVIGEGIETVDEQHAMTAVGVRYFQGFHFGRPAQADVIEKLIKQQEPPQSTDLAVRPIVA